jgi:hypothetical protein
MLSYAFPKRGGVRQTVESFEKAFQQVELFPRRNAGENLRRDRTPCRDPSLGQQGIDPADSGGLPAKKRDPDRGIDESVAQALLRRLARARSVRIRIFPARPRSCSRFPFLMSSSRPAMTVSLLVRSSVARRADSNRSPGRSNVVLMHRSYALDISCAITSGRIPGTIPLPTSPRRDDRGDECRRPLRRTPGAG